MRCLDCGYEIVGDTCLKCVSSTNDNYTTRSSDSRLINRLQSFDEKTYKRYTTKAEIDKSMHTLDGILKGIAIDSIVNVTELTEVLDWYEEHSHFVKVHPYSEIIPLIGQALKDGVLDPEEIRDILWVCNNFQTDSLYYDIITTDIQKLQGILHGILADNQITKEEIIGLKTWLNDNEHLASIYPYDEVYSLITGVLADGCITDEERNLLKAFFSEFIDLNHSKTIDAAEIKSIKMTICKQGICSVTPTLLIPNKQFCFTGKSSKTTRSGFAEAIHALGGIYKDNVSSVTDYLIVGNEGNPCWAFSCYGRKVEMAIKLRKSGHQVIIVHEHDFWDYVADLA